MKNRIRWIAVFFSICMLISICGNEAFAAGGSVSLSGVTGEVGDTVTVNGTAKCTDGVMGAVTVTLTYDPASLQYISGSAGTNGGSGSVIYSGYGDGVLTTLTFSLQFKILKEGSFKISGVADGYNFDEKQLSMSVGSATVTGKATVKEEPKEEPTKPETPTEQPVKSSNTRLSSLKVFPGELSPSFSKDVRNYTVEVPEDTQEVTFSAATEDDKASFYVSGGKELVVGENIAKVVVTAENGATNSYIITIMKKEAIPLTIVNVGDVPYTINEEFDTEKLPENFVESTVLYDDLVYQGLRYEQGDINLLNLKDEEGKEKFFIYDKDANEFYPFVQIKISNIRHIIILPIDEEIEDVDHNTLTKIMIGDNEVDACKTTTEGVYLVATAGANGEIEFYQYDEVDQTYQRRIVEEIVEEENEEEEETVSISSVIPMHILKYIDYILAGVAGVILILIVLCITFAANADKRRRRHREKIDKWKESRH